MDRPQEELQFLTIPQILRESITIPKHSPRTFYLTTLTLIFPLSFAIAAHSLFTYPLITQIQRPHQPHTAPWMKLLIFQFCYLVFLFALSLVSTAAVVFTVASVYTSKPVSFAFTLNAIPNVFKRLFITFLWVFFSMLLYNVIFFCFFIFVLESIVTHNSFLLIFAFAAAIFLFFVIHVYMTALWHLASVVSVLEPIYGFQAMKKSYELLRGKVRVAFIIVFGYLAICGVINELFGRIVIGGGEDYSLITKILVGVLAVGALVIVNLVGLLVQSVFYFVCKSFHHERIDKSVLYAHLGGFLGECTLPLKSDIRMENFEV